MRSICFYFQVHQPFRLRTYRFFDIAAKHNYYDEYSNKSIMKKVAEKCYLPMNELLLELIKEYGAAFKVSFSISGTALEQFELYAPEVLESFKKLAKTGNVEFLAETYAHSLASLISKEEFSNQVEKHVALIEKHFEQTPTTFRNTELIYSDDIGKIVSELGYKLMLTEGAKHVLGWRSPNFMYASGPNPSLKLLLKNFRLSDDIAFRFSHQGWSEWPLTAEKFVDWLENSDPTEEVVNLFVDYETFGEHQWAETGIFNFMKSLPSRVFSHSNFVFSTPAELGKKLQPVAPIHVPYPISWADEERDLTAWLGNDLQNEAFGKLYKLENKVKLSNDPDILRDWYYLQTSDHFYYMCTKWFSDGAVHKYFNPYVTPYDAFINYMNVISDFAIRVDNQDTINEELIEIKESTGRMLEKGKTLMSSIFLRNRDKSYFQKLSAKKVKAIAYEFIQDKTGGFPVIKSMSEIIGNTAVLIAAEYLSHPKFGRGIMLGGFPGIKPTEVVIIGAGTVAENAARTAIGMGAYVKIFDNSIYKLRSIQNNLGSRIFSSIMQPKILLKALMEADVVISAKHSASGIVPCYITEEMVSKMSPGSVIVDVSIDQGGCFETSKITSHKDPVYQVHGITHYCVPNIAARVPHTASYSLSNFLVPMLLNISDLGGIDTKIKTDNTFNKGVYLFNGILTNENIGEMYDLPSQDLDLLMSAFR